MQMHCVNIVDSIYQMICKHIDYLTTLPTYMVCAICNFSAILCLGCRRCILLFRSHPATFNAHMCCINVGLNVDADDSWYYIFLQMFNCMNHVFIQLQQCINNIKHTLIRFVSPPYIKHIFFFMTWSMCIYNLCFHCFVYIDMTNTQLYRFGSIAKHQPYLYLSLSLYIYIYICNTYMHTHTHFIRGR